MKNVKGLSDHLLMITSWKYVSHRLHKYLITFSEIDIIFVREDNYSVLFFSQYIIGSLKNLSLNFNRISKKKLDSFSSSQNLFLGIQ